MLNVKTKMEYELRNGEKYICLGKFKPYITIL